MALAGSLPLVPGHRALPRALPRALRLRCVIVLTHCLKRSNENKYGLHNGLQYGTNVDPNRIAYLHQYMDFHLSNLSPQPNSTFDSGLRPR